MSEPVLDPQYWKDRLARAEACGQLHHAVFLCGATRWAKIEARHREILAATIKPDESILDVGCGWGRLLDLLPKEWRGRYMGVDASPDFIAKAEKLRPRRCFVRASALDLDQHKLPTSDWAVLISFRPMIVNNLGQGVWDEMEIEIRKAARRLLFLEYDPGHEGSIE